MDERAASTLWRKDAALVLFQDLCQRSFWHFMLFAFGAKFYCEANRDEDWIEWDKHRLLCEWTQVKVEKWMLERPVADTPTKLLYLIVRKGAKSTIISEALPMWLHLRMRNLCSYIDSFDKPKSAEFLGVIQTVMAGEAAHAWWGPLYGMWKPPRGDQREWTKTQCVHLARESVEKKDPSFVCTSVATGTTGAHPDHIGEDDPIVQEKLNDERNWLKKVDVHQASLTPAMQQNALHIICMTLYTENDCGVKAMKVDKVKEFAPTGQRPHKKFYVEDPVNGKWSVFFMPALGVDGKPNFPKTWSLQRIRDYEIENPMFASSQLHLNPREGRGQLVTMEKVEALWVRRDELPTDLRISFHFDLAFKKAERRARGDYNVILVAGHSPHDGMPYVLEIERSNLWNPDEFVEKLAMMLSRYRDLGRRPFGMTDEEETSGHAGSFERWLKGELRRHGVQCPPYHAVSRAGKKKEGRIEILAGYVNTGMLRLVREAPNVEVFVNELVFYPGEKDDVVDAAADIYAEEVFRGVRVGKKRLSVPGEVRPYDDLLKGNRGSWTSAETDYVLQEQDKRRNQDPYTRDDGVEEVSMWERWSS